MKAVRIHAFGDESALRYEEAPDPVIGPDDVLIRVRYAAINRGDLGQRSGSYAAHRRLPAIIGWDVAGVIEAVGEAVADRRVGERVVVLVPRGGYAELVGAPASLVVPIPEGVSEADAASLPSAYLTAWYPLTVVSPVRPGETVLVQAGASGVGLGGIQIAKYLGARVIATAGSDEKVQFCREYGADAAINYQTHDFVAEVERLTDGRGVDFVLEQVGGDVLTNSLRCLAPFGRLISVGNTVKQTASFDPNLVLRQSLTIRGYHLPSEPDKPAHLARLLDRIAAGTIRAVVDRIFPLAEAPAAHRYLAERRNLGKILLRP